LFPKIDDQDAWHDQVLDICAVYRNAIELFETQGAFVSVVSFDCRLFLRSIVANISFERHVTPFPSTNKLVFKHWNELLASFFRHLECVLVAST